MCKVLKHHGVLLRLSSQAGKAAWPFETKSYALGSRKKVLLQCWKTGEMDAPVVFKGFFGFPIPRKKLLLSVAYRDIMFGKTIIVF